MKLFIDFDNTFIQTETLEELAEIVNCDSITKAKIEQITEQGMRGQISFHHALNQRLELINMTREHVEICTNNLKSNISESFKRKQGWLLKHAEHIIILSGGFKDIIDPIAVEFGFSPEQVFANELVYDAQGKVVGVNESNPLAHDQGKAKVAASILSGQESATMLGDGYNDYALKQAGIAGQFYLFVENIYRKELEKYADRIISSLDEITEIFNDIAIPKK